MKKTKQGLAIIGVVLLVGLYLATLLLAIFDNTNTKKFFYASIYATVIIPALLWAYSLIYKLVTKGRESGSSTNRESGSSTNRESGSSTNRESGSTNDR